jgi:hypothetical protein
MNLWNRLIQQEEEYIATLRACLATQAAEHMKASVGLRLKIAERRLRQLRARI